MLQSFWAVFDVESILKNKLFDSRPKREQLV